MGDCGECGTSSLGQEVDALVRSARPNSAAAIRLAKQILEVSGLPATLVLQIPGKPSDSVEASLTTGTVRVVLDPLQVPANGSVPEAKRPR